MNGTTSDIHRARVRSSMETTVSGSADFSQKLSRREQTRLAAILARLSSPFENERAAAGLLATAFVNKHNLMWSDVVDTLRPMTDLPAVSADPRAKHDRRRGGTRLWQ